MSGSIWAGIFLGWGAAWFVFVALERKGLVSRPYHRDVAALAGHIQPFSHVLLALGLYLASEKRCAEPDFMLYYYR